MNRILGILCTLLFMWCGYTSSAEEGERPYVVHTVDPVDDNHGLSELDYESHVKALRQRLTNGFTIVIQKPFVVAGDEAPDIVFRRAEKTVKWAVDMLKQDYFARNPNEIITIWLFKDEESYYKNARELFGDEPTTPFGYYLDSDKALVMNISTGGGTLVHEIVHPFVRTNFPECPPWFNEGLGSLYEQCGEKNGHIYAYTNWRLNGLQEAIQDGKVPSFKHLTSLSEYQFYTEDKGTNYGQARYLCYYMQEHGLLVRYYHEFYKNRSVDPTGYETLKKILNVEDMGVFKEKWERFVLELTFP